MENISQQTDESSYQDLRPWCARMWPFLWPLIISIGFVGVALLFSIIYKGFGRPVAERYMVRSCPRTQQRKSRKLEVTLSSVQKYPFVGALTSHKPYLFLCSVVVLTRRYVLTGANCFMTNFPNLWVRVSSDLSDGEGSEYKVQTFIIHEKYDGTSVENNIALIRLDENMVMGGNITPVEMGTTPTVGAADGVVLGWNYWAMAERQHVRLVEQKLLIWKPARCRKYLGNETSSKFICASLSNTLCNLDVTGPLVVDGKLAGFWSWGLSCPDVPSIFTNVHYFRRWISSKITT